MGGGERKSGGKRKRDDREEEEEEEEEEGDDGEGIPNEDVLKLCKMVGVRDLLCGLCDSQSEFALA